MSKNNELVIIDEENMKHLSLTTQKIVKELGEELDIKKLTKFNPLVQRMIDIEKYQDIKCDIENKESIDAFKEAKKDIRNFRSVTKQTKSLLKKPILETGKKLDTIEKTFIDRATKVLDALESEFKPYLDAEEEKKKAREAKKNAATTKKIEELSSEATENKIVIERMKLKEKIDKELSKYVPKAIEQAKTFSEGALAKEIGDLNALKKEGFVLEEGEKAILLDEQVEEINSVFITNIDSALHVLQTAFDKIQNIGHSPGPVAVPLPNLQNTVSDNNGEEIEMIAPSLTQENPDYFKNSLSDIISDAIDSIENLNPANEKEKSVKDGTIKGLENLEKKIIDYLSNE